MLSIVNSLMLAAGVAVWFLVLVYWEISGHATDQDDGEDAL